MEETAGDLWISADPRALQQALLNVIVNASDAVAGQRQPKIVLSMFKSGNMVQIRVADNGAGIQDERKKDLFKPFYTTKANGTGLGLVITQKTAVENERLHRNKQPKKRRHRRGYLRTGGNR